MAIRIYKEPWYDNTSIEKLDLILEWFALGDGNSRHGSNFFKSRLTYTEITEYFTKSYNVAITESFAFELSLILKKLVKDEYITLEVGYPRDAVSGSEEETHYSVNLTGIIFYEDGGYSGAIEQNRSMLKQTENHSLLLIRGSFLAGIGSIALVLVEVFKANNIGNVISIGTAFFILFSCAMAGLILGLLIKEFGCKKNNRDK